VNLIHAAYEPAGSGPHPTILALHGWGANGLDLIGLAPHLASGRFLVLCPQGRIVVPLGPVDGYGWFPLSMAAPPDAAAFAAGVEDARIFLDAAARRYPIDPAKLVVLGFSQGGVIAYALALQEPARVAGVVALSSWLPEAVVQAPSAQRQAGFAVLVHHGARDELIPVTRGRESVETLRRWQLPVTYREFDMGHEITAASLRDLSTWLQDKIVSPIVLA
jgi:phospholipase/carboxylesterase